MGKFDIKISSKDEKEYMAERIEKDILAHLKEHKEINSRDIEEIIRHAVDYEKEAMLDEVTLFYEAIFENMLEKVWTDEYVRRMSTAKVT